jgi:hypothetical protein
MTTTDHRSPGIVRGLAVACSIASGAYLLPAVAGLPALMPALRPLRRPFGIADRTLDGRGYALTFDDGPHAEGTPAVLEILAARGVHATFFLVGEQVARNPSLAGEIVAAGHGIGLHCDRHRNLLRLGPGAVREDIARARALIEETTGRSIERYRPPYGIFNAAALTIAKQNDWRPLLWTHWGRDWAASATRSRLRSGSSAVASPKDRCCCCTTLTTTRRPARGGRPSPRCHRYSMSSPQAGSSRRSRSENRAAPALGANVTILLQAARPYTLRSSSRARLPAPRWDAQPIAAPSVVIGCATQTMSHQIPADDDSPRMAQGDTRGRSAGMAGRGPCCMWRGGRVMRVVRCVPRCTCR